MKLHIKYMVSIRCKMAVQRELDRLGLMYGAVELGEVEVRGGMDAEVRVQLAAGLLKSGLLLMEDKKAILIEKIKLVVIDMVHYARERPKENFSDFLSQKLQYDYTYLANLFSEVTGTTIEHYIIAHKLEKVKELLLYDELSLTQISYQLNYSSVAHLSNQFKKVTGLTPSFFKKLKSKKRLELEQL